jgi:hypothetical protein
MLAKNKFLITFIYFILFFVFYSSGQKNAPLLERKVSFEMSNESAENVLQAIAKQNNFTFSYVPQVIADKKPVTMRVTNKTVREVLDQLFDGQVSFKEKGNHIILFRKDAKKNEEESLFIITGYVKDSNGNEITQASIFEKQSRESTISNKYGFYKLEIESKNKEKAIALFVNKFSYKDTVIYVRQTGKSIINITLFPDAREISGIDSTAIYDSLLRVDQLAFVNFLLSQEAKVNAKNITDTIYRKFQISFVPYLGSNLRLSGNTVNDFSLNVLGGYSMGTKKLELAGLFNIDRDSVKYFQGAGLFNITGGPVSGVQMGGLANANLKAVNGLEFAGLVNLNFDSMRGGQFSGLVNVNLKPVTGFQGAGLLNVNIAETYSTQCAGLINISNGNSSGAQIAGLINVSVKDFSGVQISGLINYAKSIHGAQIGFLNISDSCSGVPIGFLSYVHKGYHQLEISANEIYPLNVSLRTGVRSLYNILSAGMKFDSLADMQWYFGYGLGTAMNLGKKWQLDFDITMNQPLKGNKIPNFSPLSILNITAEKRLSKYFTIAAGPSFNYFVYKSNDVYPQSFASNAPTTVISTSKFSKNYLSKAWIGGKIAFRFF